MSKVRLLSRSFAGGEITPDLADRVDLGQHQTGLAQCINAIIYPHGPAQKRGGTVYVNRAKYWWEGDFAGTYDRNVQLIPFQFSADQSYCLEFGHHYVRFHTEGQTLLEGVNIAGEMIRSEGVNTGAPNRITIHKTNHGLTAGKKILVTATPSDTVGTNKGNRTVAEGIPVQAGIMKNDYWVITDSGTLLGRPVVAGYLLRAKQDDPFDIATDSAGSISGTAYTEGGTITGTFSADYYLFDDAGSTITAGTKINSGSSPNWTVNTSQTVGPVAITGRKINNLLWEIVPMEDWSQFDGTTEYTVEDPVDGADDDMFCIDVDSTLTSGTPPIKSFKKITRAKEAKVFATAHGFNDGDIVCFTKLNQKRPDKVNFNDQIPYKVSDKTADTFKIKVEIDVDEDGTTEWVYLNTKKAFRNGRLPKGYVSSTVYVPDVAVADVEYTVIRAVTCEGDDVFTQDGHGLYDGQVVWFDAENVSPYNRSDYYQVGSATSDTFQLVEIGQAATVIGPGSTGMPALAGYVYPIYEVETDYDSADICELDFAQSYDVLTIAHKNYPPSTLRRNSASDWSFDQEVFIPTIDVPVETRATVSGNTGHSKRKVYYAVTAIENDEESYPAYIERPALEVSQVSGRVTYERVPYFMGDGYYNDPISTNTTTGPAIKLSSGTLAFGALVRLEAGESMSDDFITAMEGEDMNDNLYLVTARLSSGWYIMSRRSKTPVDWILYEGGLNSGDLNVYRSGSVEVDFDTVTTCRVSLSWKAKPWVVYNIYKRTGGNGGDPLGYIGRTDGGFFTDDGITPDISITPPLGDSPFAAEGNYPACVDYFEQRKVYAGTESRPQNVWLTRIATERNMLQSLPVQDADAIHFRMAGREQNAIKFMAALQDLILFTENSEWRVTANDAALTPSTIMVRQQGASGCADVKPVVANGSILFVQSGSNRVLQMNYNWNAQSYQADDISMMAYHLFENQNIIAMTLERGAFPILWTLRDDGVLLALTYVPGQNVVAWHHHEIDGGHILSVRALKESTGPVVYLAVRRSAGGVISTSIERMDNYTNWLSRNYLDSEKTQIVERGYPYPEMNLGG